MRKIILLTLFLIILTGCGSSNKFDGTWYHYDGYNMSIFTFYDDNKCSLEEFGEEEKCTYKYDNKKLTISTAEDDLELDYSFKDNYLVIGDINFYKDMKDAKDNAGSSQENKVVGNRTKNIVPDVVGKNIEEAKKIFEERGFEINIVSVRNDMYENGIVVETNPGSGMVADKNNIIDVFVSSTY